MFEVSIGTNGFEKLRVKLVTARASVLKEFHEAVRETTDNAVKEIKGRFSGTDAEGPKALTMRSGDLSASVYGKTSISSADIKVAIGTTSPYGAIQEKGGTIHGDPLLGIPIGAALDPSGTPYYKSIKDVQVPLFRITSKLGNILLVAKDGNGIVPYYVLKESVTLKPGRLGLEAAIKRNFSEKNSYFDKRFRAASGRILSAK